MIKKKARQRKKFNYRFFLLLVLPLLASACKMQGPYYRGGHSGDFPAPQGELHHSVFLMGDAGDAQKDSKYFDAFEKIINEAGAQSDVVSLGDNAYPVGLPGELNKWRSKAEEALDKQIEVFSAYEEMCFLWAATTIGLKASKKACGISETRKGI